jgi:uncharacterized Fe-S cluster-containing protein
MSLRQAQRSAKAVSVAADAKIVDMLHRATALRREYDELPDGVEEEKLEEANSLACRAERVAGSSVIGAAAKVAFSDEFECHDMDHPLKDSACRDVQRLAKMAVKRGWNVRRRHCGPPVDRPGGSLSAAAGVPLGPFCGKRHRLTIVKDLQIISLSVGFLMQLNEGECCSSRGLTVVTKRLD